MSHDVYMYSANVAFSNVYTTVVLWQLVRAPTGVVYWAMPVYEHSRPWGGGGQCSELCVHVIVSRRQCPIGWFAVWTSVQMGLDCFQAGLRYREIVSSYLAWVHTYSGMTVVRRTD